MAKRDLRPAATCGVGALIVAAPGGTCGVERDLLARLCGVCHMSSECCFGMMAAGACAWNLPSVFGMPFLRRYFLCGPTGLF